MIQFNKKYNTFTLSNNEITYCIYLNSEGYLEKIYFGAFIKDIDLNFINSKRKLNVNNGSNGFFDVKNNKETEYKDKYDNYGALLEIGSHGLSDKRGAPIIIKKNKNYNVTNFHYSSFKIIKGFKKYNGIPYVFDNFDAAETLEIFLKDEYSDTYLTYNISIFNDLNIIVKNFEILNNNCDDIYIEKASSLQLDLENSCYSLVHFYGSWAHERNKEEINLHHGLIKISSNSGRSSHEENPFIYLKSMGADYTNGEVIGFNLVYSGNFSFEINTNCLNNPRILYGINEEDFDYLLRYKEKFISPQAIISYSNKGIDYMSQTFATFIKKHIISYKNDKEYKSILFNSWEGCYFNFTTDSIIKYIEDSKKIGTELFVLDDGWFGNRNDDSRGLGDWFINTKKIDLKKISNKVHELNMKFGLWFEPEMINPDSILFSCHSEYVLGNYDHNLSLSRHQLVLDFSNEEVVNNIFKQMCLILDNYQIDYIKWDHNRFIGEHYSKKYSNNEQGMIYHKNILGYYSLLEKIIKRYPSLMIEGCASGGGRFDLGTLYYCPQIWASDNQDPLVRIFIQYNTSLGYPLSCIGSHANNSSNASYSTKARLALFGTYGYEMNPNDLNENEIKELNEVAKIYTTYHKNVIENGILYHLIEPQINDKTMSLLSVDLDKKTGLLLLIFDSLIEKESINIKLKGLSKNDFYINSYDNKSYKGEYYIQKGLDFRCLKGDSYLITINKIKGE